MCFDLVDEAAAKLNIEVSRSACSKWFVCCVCCVLVRVVCCNSMCCGVMDEAAAKLNVEVGALTRICVCFCAFCEQYLILCVVCCASLPSSTSREE